MSSDATKKARSTFFSKWSLVFSKLMWSLWSVLTFLVFCYIAFSALVLYSKEVKMEIIYSHRIRSPWFANLSSCKDFGLVKCEQVYLNGYAGKLGAWFISPASQQYITREAYILYLHGNMGSRAMHHRVQFYKRLSKMGYHILAIDYRGFGDSEGSPSEEGLVEDSKIAYKWLNNRARGFAIYVWGHSLGSAVAVQLSSWLNAERAQLNGVVLEAPFNNITDAIIQTPLALPLYQFLPNFESYLDDVKNVFLSTFWIQKVTSPTLILHDVSDSIININLARKLYAVAKANGSTNVRMIEFDEQLDHCEVSSAKQFKKLFSDFVFHTS
ncbi:lysophosphatidylserine lipase ABHD12 isoform X1 [Hydra vulgaris]|uniref:Monoacylglycerol lipase ABHD12 n=1 Tax=Hydra vulgaris TaxID=6087 RepID=T2M9T0_HYDVU|nr:lysophosphatidylserine lipase ABHD12 isoform X1 [Hydra vulgaris]